MTPSETIDRLTAADPAAELRPQPDEALIAKLVAVPPAAPPRRAPGALRRPALAAAAVAVTVAALAATALLAGGRADLAARAYAQTAPADYVLHTHVTSSQHLQGPNLPGGGTETKQRIERWQYGREVHARITAADGVYDQHLGRDGVLRNRLPDGEVQEVRSGDGGEAHELLTSYQDDPVTTFRRRYEEGALTDAGDTTFAGRPARAYTRTTRQEVPDEPRFNQKGGTQTATETFYLDRETATPLGSRQEIVNPSGRYEFVDVIDRFEKLPATPENLALVRG